MSYFRPFYVSFFCAAVLLTSRSRGQTSPAALPAAVPPPPDKIEQLDRFVVTAGPDPKTSFDLAQGTSVLAGDELRRIAQSTLGETLASTPGVASTYFGPGASRPVIRGLGGDRIRVLGNGIGALDASNVSPDHNAALEPLFASRIEVLRGPSTLLYGSSAVGGVVNVIDNTIPETAPEGRADGAIELRAGGAADERAAVLSVGGGAKGLAVRVNALDQRTDDLRIPGVARIDADAPPHQPRGTLPDSFTDTLSVGGGASVFWPAGRVGAGIMHYKSNYGVPTDEPGISIRMNRTRVDLSAEITRPFGVFRSARARLGAGNYSHSELSGGSVTNTTFRNKAWEGRLELPHAMLGNLTGTLGLQGSRSDFSAAGEEVVTPPSLTHTGAIFALEELKFGERATLQFGARLEGQTIELGEVDPGLPALPGYSARTGQKNRFGGASGSAGLVLRPAKDWSLGAALAYTERLPTAQELFSNGPHAGTGAYEVGTSGLASEKSVGLDVILRRRAGFVTGSVGVFVNRFRNYIFERALPPGAIPTEINEDGLAPFQFVARDASFHGAEAEVAVHFIDEGARLLHLDLMADTVRAQQTTDAEPLPRIPPLRYGAKLTYEDGRWGANLEVRHSTRQARLAPGETSTPAHTLVHAGVSCLIATSRISYELFVRGRNLTNASAREHTSFLKEFAPLPGRGVMAGVRLSF